MTKRICCRCGDLHAETDICDIRDMIPPSLRDTKSTKHPRTVCSCCGEPWEWVGGSAEVCDECSRVCDMEYVRFDDAKPMMRDTPTNYRRHNFTKLGCACEWVCEECCTGTGSMRDGHCGECGCCYAPKKSKNGNTPGSSP